MYHRWFDGPWWTWPWPSWFLMGRRLQAAWDALPSWRKQEYADAWHVMGSAGKVTMAQAADAMMTLIRATTRPQE